MREPTALLVSQSPSLIDAVKGASESLDHLNVEVCPEGGQACARVLRDDVALVLAHLTPDGAAGITALLRTVAESDRSCTVLVLDDSRQGHQAGRWLCAGAADHLELPAELPKLQSILA